MLIFDGDCGFCTRCAEWLRRRLPDSVQIVPWQHLDLDVYGLSEHDVITAAYWVDADGGLHRGHAAIARGLVEVGGVWKPVGWMMMVPPVSWAARGVYRLVARNRHRMPGASATCKVPVEAEGPGPAERGS